MIRRHVLALALAASALGGRAARAEVDTILNASYDVARELFAEINPAFAKAWQAKTGKAITIDQSHGGSSRQARAVLEGLQADVVTFNQEVDVQVLGQRHVLQQRNIQFQRRFPHIVADADRSVDVLGPQRGRRAVRDLHVGANRARGDRHSRRDGGAPRA